MNRCGAGCPNRTGGQQRQPITQNYQSRSQFAATAYAQQAPASPHELSWNDYLDEATVQALLQHQGTYVSPQQVHPPQSQLMPSDYYANEAAVQALQQQQQQQQPPPSSYVSSQQAIAPQSQLLSGDYNADEATAQAFWQLQQLQLLHQEQQQQQNQQQQQQQQQHSPYIHPQQTIVSQHQSSPGNYNVDEATVQAYLLQKQPQPQPQQQQQQQQQQIPYVSPQQVDISEYRRLQPSSPCAVCPKPPANVVPLMPPRPHWPVGRGNGTPWRSQLPPHPPPPPPLASPPPASSRTVTNTPFQNPSRPRSAGNPSETMSPNQQPGVSPSLQYSHLDPVRRALDFGSEGDYENEEIDGERQNDDSYRTAHEDFRSEPPLPETGIITSSLEVTLDPQSPGADQQGTFMISLVREEKVAESAEPEDEQKVTPPAEGGTCECSGCSGGGGARGPKPPKAPAEQALDVPPEVRALFTSIANMMASEGVGNIGESVMRMRALVSPSDKSPTSTAPPPTASSTQTAEPSDETTVSEVPKTAAAQLMAIQREPTNEGDVWKAAITVEDIEYTVSASVVNRV